MHRMMIHGGRWGSLVSLLVCLVEYVGTCSFPIPTGMFAEKTRAHVFTSPNTNNSSLRDVECGWRVSTNLTGHVIKLEFEALDPERSVATGGATCLVDYVLVLDGGERSAQPLGQWCGVARQVYSTSTQHAYIYFRSQKLSGGRRFRVHYAVEEKGPAGDCGARNSISAVGMFGYVTLGWVALILILKILWDRLKKVKRALSDSDSDTTNPRGDELEPRFDVSIISLTPPSYDNEADYPDEAPPPYRLNTGRAGSSARGAQAHVVFENFILSSVPPPAYDQATNSEDSGDTALSEQSREGRGSASNQSSGR